MKDIQIDKHKNETSSRMSLYEMAYEENILKIFLKQGLCYEDKTKTNKKLTLRLERRF